MPFEEHPEFLAPNSPDSKIWRYIDLAKFLSLLHNRALYFSRLDQLSDSDPFEGYYTQLNIDFDQIPFSDLPSDWKKVTGIKDKNTFKKIVGFNKIIRENIKHQRKLTFVNSWHLNEYESAAMWNVYLNRNEGIAIQSTYQRLIDSLDSYKDFNVFVGRIKYIDYQSEAISMANGLSPFIHKRKSFEYEDELRALIWTLQNGGNDLNDPNNNKYSDTLGLNVPVDLSILVEKVYVSLSAPSWLREIVASVAEKYGLQKEIVQSDLASRPIY